MLNPDAELPYYAVIFVNQRTRWGTDDYAKAADAMMALAKRQPGFLGVDSVRDAQGFGITVSYWQTLDDVKAFRGARDHAAIQDQGRTDWYEWYERVTAKVESHHRFARDGHKE